ncbi:MAG: alpha/beta hydrolase [Flavobacteriaceae bacterium]|nr:alpha/beta hydrolase [Flavobacteriaceae bacterium]
MNVLKIIFSSILFLSGVAHASPEIIDSNAVVYKTLDGVTLKLHVYNPTNFDTQTMHNAIIFFHGGGWNNGSHKAFKRQSMYFASRGMVAISAEYRLKNTHGTTPYDAVEDAKSAIRYVRANAHKFKINPNTITAGGGSAGGHLAASCGLLKMWDNSAEDLTVSSKPNALVLLNPVLDLGPDHYAHKRFGKDFKLISPMQNISKNAPPTLILVGTEDRILPVPTVKKYQSIMESFDNRCDVVLYQDQRHAFFAKPPKKYFVETTDEIDRFLVSLGLLDGQSTIKNQYNINNQ